jgi:hypothetical protein
MRTRSSRGSPRPVRYARAWSLVVLGLSLVGGAGRAAALPSYSWQTGLPCTQCHVQGFGPDLTDFGRQFKLNGYVWGDRPGVPFIPLAAMLQTSFTHTGQGQPGGATPHFNDNNNVALDQLSLFYAGRIVPHVGAFVQGTYDGVTGTALLDNVDIRAANQGTVLGIDLVYGVSFNNNPTVQDLWNTTPAWGFPFASSRLAPTPAATTLIDGGLAQQVAGLTVYSLWHQLLYIEAGAYRTLAAHVQRTLGTNPDGEQEIDGFAPYWRVALQRQWGQHYVSLGTFGLYAAVFPGREQQAGHDFLTDVGIDAAYQYQTGPHQVTLNATLITEPQHLPASQALGNASNRTDHLTTFRTRASYNFQQTYGGTFAYFQTTGTTDPSLYAPAPITGSASGSPTSRGFITELAVVPFGKATSLWAPWLNVRLSLQYVAYLTFNGGHTNYDGFGRDARANNTLYLLSWFAF